jgi:hypothetical protein
MIDLDFQPHLGATGLDAMTRFVTSELGDQWRPYQPVDIDRPDITSREQDSSGGNR